MNGTTRSRFALATTAGPSAIASIRRLWKSINSSAEISRFKAGIGSPVKVEQALDRGVDALDIRERELRREQQLQCHAVDRLDLQLAAERLDPVIAVDGGHPGLQQSRSMPLDMAVGLAARGVIWQHESQHLDEIAVRDVALGDLPIERHDTGAEPDIALVEIVVRQCRRKPVLDRMPFG